MTLPSTPNSHPPPRSRAGPSDPGHAAAGRFSPPTTPVKFPLDWLMAHAAAADPLPRTHRSGAADADRDRTGLQSPLYARTRAAVGRAAGDGRNVGRRNARAPFRQARQHFEGIGTIPAVRRLIELGWNKDTPPLVHARRALFRLLAEDDDPVVPVRARRKARAGRGRSEARADSRCARRPRRRSPRPATRAIRGCAAPRAGSSTAWPTTCARRSRRSRSSGRATSTCSRRRRRRRRSTS